MKWEKRNTVDASRMDELVELYESIGFEVRLEKIEKSDSLDVECSVCLENRAEDYFIIYTRKKSSS